MRNHRPHRHPRSIHGLATLGAAALAVLALAACGGGEEGSGSGAEGAGDGRVDRAKLEQAALKHAECMRKQGIDVPDPKPGQGGVILRGPRGGGDTSAQERAERRCSRYLRNVPPPKLSDEQKSAMRDGALKHARCMREQGIEFPDPTFDEDGGIRVKIGDGFDPGDPRVRRAEQKCRKLLPMPGGEPSG
ncbi:MAG: hypothetical protein M3131_04785 [Actinomycetota bacterium]|nr:hypothetical protein [Actinomycetota bacterium]